MKSISAILLQKNRILRDSIADFLVQGGLQVLGQAASISELISQLKDKKPHIVILDMELVGDKKSMFDLFRNKLPQSMLILTGPGPRDYYAEYAKRVGVDLYLSVDSDPNQWKHEIRKIIKLKEIDRLPNGTIRDNLNFK